MTLFATLAYSLLAGKAWSKAKGRGAACSSWAVGWRGVAAAGGGGAGARLPTGQADAISQGFFIELDCVQVLCPILIERHRNHAAVFHPLFFVTACSRVFITVCKN